MELKGNIVWFDIVAILGMRWDGYGLGVAKIFARKIFGSSSHPQLAWSSADK